MTSERSVVSVSYETAVAEARRCPESRPALEELVSAMVREGRLKEHAVRELVFRAARRQGLRGDDLLALLLERMGIESRLVSLVGKTYERQFKLMGRDVGVQDNTVWRLGKVSDVTVCWGDAHEYAFVGGRRLLIDMLMDPEATLPPEKGVTDSWRIASIERFVDRAREIGLTAPEVGREKNGEEGGLAISFGEGMTNVRGSGSTVWSKARFRVTRKGLVYRCRFSDVSDPEQFGFYEPDLCECDPRFATAPSGGSRYVAPLPKRWSFRGVPPDTITPFGHVVRHVEWGDMGHRLQTPYDLRSAVIAHSTAWLAGPQPTADKFMRLVSRLGLGDWLRHDPTAPHAWRSIHERDGVSFDVEFVNCGDLVAAEVHFSIEGSRRGHVVVDTPRRLYEIVRDTLWCDPDGREQHDPRNVAPWTAAVNEKTPTDDGIR
jgi:hypothetical protein